MAVSITKFKKPASPKITFVEKVIKQDTYLVLADAQRFPEDEFTGLYYSETDTSKVFIEPPFNPNRLIQFPQVNNILSQCIEAMEVNIDGTGHELESVDPAKEPNKGEIEQISAFLAEPYPNRSLISIRRELRRELESLGYGALEILRNVKDEIVGIRNIPGYTLRLVRLDAPVQVTKTVKRGGKDVELTYWDRERRFAQKLFDSTKPNRFLYFKEFGASRHVHRETGDWESDTNKVPAEKRGTELLFFRVLADLNSPYGVPRWINQLPSVVGSRKAEEANLEFFDSGGLPPAIIFIEGGTLAADMSSQLKMYLSGQLKNRHRAAVVEAQASSGSIESSGQVKVHVERFGSESSKDAMYQAYDKSAEDHVRIGFRLPPLFIGKATDYTYATASISYRIAEAQVFGPERLEFDEMFNATIMKALGAETCRFKSKPITLKNLDSQLQALTLVKDITEGTEFVEEINNIADLSLAYKEPPPPPNPFGMEAGPNGTKPNGEPSLKTKGKIAPEENAPKGKGEKAPPVQKMLALAQDFCKAEGLIPSKFEYSESDKETIRKSVDALPGPERELLNRFVSIHVQAALESGEVGPAVEQ